VYLEEYDRIRGTNDPRTIEAFVFAGTKGFPFPRAAETHFRQYYDTLREELYGLKARST
jgi:hypothetical protein